MADQIEESVFDLFARLQQGRESAAGQLWERYCPRLTGLARRVLGGRPHHFPEAEDAALSAMASFCLAAQDRRIQGDIDGEALWRLLKCFTIRKAAKVIEAENAKKRGGGKVVSETAWTADASSKGLDAAFEKVLTPDFDLSSEEMLDKLQNEELRTIALAKLMGYTNQDIAQRLECTERRIERKLQGIRAAWEDLVER